MLAAYAPAVSLLIWPVLTVRKQGGLQHVTYAASLQQSAAWIFQGDTAWLPAIPLSPHAHLVGSLTAAEPQPLPEPFKSVCDGASGTGLVYVSMGTTAAPGKRFPATQTASTGSMTTGSCCKITHGAEPGSIMAVLWHGSIPGLLDSLVLPPDPVWHDHLHDMANSMC